MLPATLLIGLAFGLGFSSLSVAATAGVPDAEQGLAASLFQTSFQVGGAVVLAVVTAVIDAGGAGRVLSPAATLAAYRPALILITGVAAAGTLVALSGLRLSGLRLNGLRLNGLALPEQRPSGLREREREPVTAGRPEAGLAVSPAAARVAAGASTAGTSAEASAAHELDQAC
jgi:hypothetical protein